MYSQHKEIRDRIMGKNPGTVFTLNDFSDISTTETTSKILTRLCDTTALRKIIRGVFWLPDGAGAKPLPDSVARAIARGNRWKIVPCGDTALYLFGLRKEAPAIWTYVTDGTYCSHVFDDVRIDFRHTSGRFINSMSEKAANLVWVLKAYGKEYMTEELFDRMKNRFSREEWAKIAEETKHTAAWITKAVKKIFAAGKGLAE